MEQKCCVTVICVFLCLFFEINAIFAEKNLNEVCLKLVIFTVL